MRVTGIGWAGIWAEDFHSTVQFFSGVMELPVAYRDETREIVHFRFRSGQLLEIFGPANRWRKEKYQWFNGPALGFEVDDVELAYREMTARGTRFISELETWEDDMWAMFLGPEDKLFEILKPTRHPAQYPGNVSGICWAGVPVQEFAPAVQFFSQAMEMSLAQQEHGEEAAQCWLPGGQLFEVYGSSTGQGQHMPHCAVGFEVDDIAEARREMESQGVAFTGPTEILTDGYAWAPFRAPDGFIYHLRYKPDYSSLEK